MTTENKKENKEVYFFIELDHLPKDEAVLGFNICLYEPNSKSYKIDLHAGTPFDGDVRERYKLYLSKGAQLAINYKQKKTFLFTMNLKEEDIPSLKSIASTPEEQRRLATVESLKTQNFHFGSAFKTAIKTNDFELIITRAREEILTLPPNLNQTLSNVLMMTDLLLQGDCLHNRIIATSYFLAVNAKMNKPDELGDLLHAAYLYDIGLTQLSLNYQKVPLTKLNQRAKEDYENHTGLTMHLVRKSKINFNLRAKKLIQEHHERYNGTGYPSAKQDPYIERLGQLLALVDYAFHFAEGRMTGTSMPLDEVVSNIKNRLPIQGLDLDFNPDLVTAFYALCFRSQAVKTDEEKKAA